MGKYHRLLPVTANEFSSEHYWNYFFTNKQEAFEWLVVFNHSYYFYAWTRNDFHDGDELLWRENEKR